MTEKKSSRILTFDLLRGYFLVAIILDHLAFYPNGLDWWSGRGGLYVSAAEGFFLISGIVLGIVRGAKLVDKPFSLTVKMLLQRSLQLYVTAVILMLLFTFIGWLFLDNPGLKPGIRPPTEGLLDIIWGGLTFEYIYGWADYLRLYAIFILFTPIAMWLLRRGLWYIVLAISVFVWAQFDTLRGDSLELAQVYSWQLIFFTGITIGFYWKSIASWWQKRSNALRRVTVASVVTVAAITMVGNFLLAYGDELFGLTTDLTVAINNALVPYFVKEALPWPRLLLFAVWFGASFWLFNRFEKQIIGQLGWLLLPFGANSLYVYTLHAVLVFFVHLLIFNATASILINFTLSVAGVMLIWIAVRSRFLMKIIPR